MHITWKTKDILNIEHIFAKNCIQNVVKLSPTWKPIISDDHDIEQYLKENLSKSDYQLLKERPIVEKTDVWRLLKLYIEGGLYIDIDRLCNMALDDILTDDIKCILPVCGEHNFSHDFMCSAPGNPIFLETLNLNLERRHSGHTSIYLLGPQTYFHGATKVILGKLVDVNPPLELYQELMQVLANIPFVMTYKELPPYNTITYQPKKSQIKFDHETMKRDFYAKCKLQHWTGDW
jgi:hypothetical protein